MRRPRLLAYNYKQAYLCFLPPPPRPPSHPDRPVIVSGWSEPWQMVKRNWTSPHWNQTEVKVRGPFDRVCYLSMTQYKILHVHVLSQPYTLAFPVSIQYGVTILCSSCYLETAFSHDEILEIHFWDGENMGCGWYNISIIILFDRHF